jgi:hypothetical protein
MSYAASQNKLKNLMNNFSRNDNNISMLALRRASNSSLSVLRRVWLKSDAGRTREQLTPYFYDSVRPLLIAIVGETPDNAVAAFGRVTKNS